MPDDIGAMTPEEITALREERDRLLAERDAERRRADSEASRADGLHGQVIDSGRRLNESAVEGIEAQVRQTDATIGSIGAELAGLKKELASLYADAKFEEAAEVQERIGDATARRAAAVQAKAWFSQQRESAAALPTDPIERFFQANPRLNEAEREWIRHHPRYAFDTDFQARVIAAHGAALSRGIARQSPEYFAELERAGYQRAAPPAPAPADPNAGDRDDAADTPYSDAATPSPEDTVPVTPPRRQSAAAPPSRRAPTAPPTRRLVASLSEEEADTALRNADLAPKEIREEGDAAILNWWAGLKNSSTAARLRQEWAAR